MVTNDENVLKLKHKVIEEVARLAWTGDFDEENYERITYKLIPGPRATYRCCIYKERELIRQKGLFFLSITCCRLGIIMLSFRSRR